LILLVLLLIAIVFALGFVVTALLWVALALFVLWIVGWWARPAGRNWYLW
jgi:hypothetical protein